MELTLLSTVIFCWNVLAIFYSNLRSQTSSINTIWELISHIDSQASPRLREPEPVSSRDRQVICIQMKV